MNKTKKITMGVLASVAAFAIPVVTVVSCGKKDAKEVKNTNKLTANKTSTIKNVSKPTPTTILKAKDIASQLKVTGSNGRGIIDGVFTIKGIDFSLSYDKVKKLVRNGVEYKFGVNNSLRNGETVTIICKPKKGFKIESDSQYKTNKDGSFTYKIKVSGLKTIIDKKETILGAGGKEFYGEILLDWFEIPANITTITVNSFSLAKLPEGFVIPSTVTKIITMKEYAKTHKPIQLMDKKEAFEGVVLPKGFKDESNTKVKYDFSKNPVQKGYIWDETTRSVIKK